MAFVAGAQLLNPAGFVQGGFLAGDLSDEGGRLVAVATATVQIRSQML